MQPEDTEQEAVMPESQDLFSVERDLKLDGSHNWIQRGYEIICTNCPLEHARRIGEHLMLTGVDQSGEPILKSRTELGMV